MNIFAQQNLSGCTVVGAKKPKKENSQTAYQRYLRAIEQVTRTGFEQVSSILLFSGNLRKQAILRNLRSHNFERSEAISSNFSHK